MDWTGVKKVVGEVQEQNQSESIRVNQSQSVTGSRTELCELRSAFFAMLCFAMPCYALLCPALLCYALLQLCYSFALLSIRSIVWENIWLGKAGTWILIYIPSYRAINRLRVSYWFWHTDSDVLLTLCLYRLQSASYSLHTSYLPSSPEDSYLPMILCDTWVFGTRALTYSLLPLLASVHSDWKF